LPERKRTAQGFHHEANGDFKTVTEFNGYEEMVKTLSFDCKYADGVKKRTHRRLLYETPVSGLHLQTKSNHSWHS
jgi:hypothetical protein